MKRRVNIGLIFLIIGVFLWPNLGYSYDTFFLRIPVEINKGRANGAVEQLDETKLIQRIKECIVSHDWESAITILMQNLGKGTEKDIYSLLFKGVDITFDKIFENFRYREKACGDFHLKLARKARRSENTDVLLALSDYYTNARRLKDHSLYIRAMKQVFSAANEILKSDDDKAKQEIINEFIPLVIDSFPRKTLYWTSIPYKGEIVTLFANFAELYPDHPFLIEACKEIVGLDDAIAKRLKRRRRLMLPKRAVYSLIGKQKEKETYFPLGGAKMPAVISDEEDNHTFLALYGENNYKKMQKEIKRFLSSWNVFVNSFVSASKLLRDITLRTDNSFYHFEWLENLSVHIIKEADERGFIKEDDEETFIALPIGINIPLKMGGRETLLRRSDGKYYHTKYSLDYDGIKEVFKDKLFFGLNIGSGRENEIWYNSLIWASLQPKFSGIMEKVRNNKDRLIDKAVSLESIDRDLTEEDIRSSYDSIGLVKKWLRKLGIMKDDEDIVTAEGQGLGEFIALLEDTRNDI